ncbi:PepSY-associated TM helix domain-containing protein [Zymomonas mobilis]|uniref:PepSY-associated TM helix domain-containing protein n=1 Tax=Zymomonas mobilis TaxID=542 RepID=UPI0039EABB4E
MHPSSPVNNSVPEPAPQSANSRKNVTSFHTIVKKQVRLWHWVSAAIFCVTMLLFSVTGFMMNHGHDIFAPHLTTTEKQFELPQGLLPALQQPLKKAEEKSVKVKEGGFDWGQLASQEVSQPLPENVVQWLKSQHLPAKKQAFWTDKFVYFVMPKLGMRDRLLIERDNGHVHYEHTSRGWIGFIDDLHRGGHVGTGWPLFIDVFAIACIIFSISGIWLLQIHARKRPSTWPLVALGLAVPIVIILVALHSH